MNSNNLLFGKGFILCPTKKLVPVWVDNLNLFTLQEVKDLADKIEVNFCQIPPNLLIFDIKFYQLPKIGIWSYLEKYNYHQIDAQTYVKFQFSAKKLFCQANVAVLIENFLLKMFPANNLTLNFDQHSLHVDQQTISLNLTSRAMWKGLEKISFQLQQFLKFVFHDIELQFDFNLCDSTIEVSQLELNLVNKNNNLTKLDQSSKPNGIDNAKKLSQLNSDEIFTVWQLKEKIISINQSIFVIQIKNQTNYFCCSIRPELMKTQQWKQMKAGALIKVQLGLATKINRANLVDFELINFTFIGFEPNLIDAAPIKITNLSVHTKNSTQDGLFQFADLAQFAKQVGQTSLAITDWCAVNAYPLVEKTAKNLGIKPIYGVELEVIEPQITLVLNSDQIQASLHDAVYCVFDIETTGLNGLFDDIIEIAVTKYHHNVVVDQYQQFVQTKQKIKPHITEITRIDNDTLIKSGVPIKAALEKFINFTHNCVLVAHNGINFDLPFINAALKKQNKPSINNCLIDTLQLSRAIFTAERAHSLGALCRRLSIDYDEYLAHRADQDVNVLASAFFKLFSTFVERQIDLNGSISQLNQCLQSKALLEKNYTSTVCIYAKNQAGIKRIYQLVSHAHTEFFLRTPTITWEEINKQRENLIVTNHPVNNNLMDAVLMFNYSQFVTNIANYDYVFIPSPKCYVHEINRNNYDLNQIEMGLQLFCDWSVQLNKLVIASVPVKYLRKENQNQYAALVHAKAIGGITHRLFSYQQANNVLPAYEMRLTCELVDEFAFLSANLEAKENFLINNNQTFVNEISDQIQIIQNRLFTPELLHGEKLFIDLTKANFVKKYGSYPATFLIDRFNRELNAIIKHKFSIIYWASHLLVKKSIEDGYPVASRGSVGSSLVAYLLNITEVNPLPAHYYCSHCFYTELHADLNDSGFDLPIKPCPQCNQNLTGDGQNIPFETFMGFDADKTPDIDLNFSGEYQNQAHNFLKQLFGDKACFRAGTISTIAAKTAYGFAKNYFELTNQSDHSVGHLDWIINQIVGVKRTSGQHPGGILVIPKNMDVHDFTPINFPADDTSSDWKTTHLEYEYLHDSLLKFDILGHDDPTVLRVLHQLTKVDPRTIPNHDPKVLQLFQTCRIMGISPEQILQEPTGAIGLPEFGTQFVRGMLNEAKPKSFGDLIRISGLSHGTNVWRGNADKLIKKNNLKLSEVIGCRDDIMVYLISQNVDPLLAFNVMESVRKGKQIPSTALPTLIAQKIPQWYIQSANLIKYMFPKAHAAAYVLMAWRVAYYKFYYPKEYYATYFSIRSDNFDVELLMQNDPYLIEQRYREIKNKLNSKNPVERLSVKTKEKNLLTIYEVALEMLARKIKFLPVNLEQSDSVNFLVSPTEEAILIPFIAIDGLGKIVAETIVNERKVKAFLSKKDLTERTRLSFTLLERMDKMCITNKLNQDNQISLFENF